MISVLTDAEAKLLRESLNGFQAVYVGHRLTAARLQKRFLVKTRKISGVDGLQVTATPKGRETIEAIDREFARRAEAREREKAAVEETRVRIEREKEEEELRLKALIGKRVRLFSMEEDEVVVEGVVELREPYLVIPAPDGRCPYFVHARRRVEVVE